jgi:hypothetical protein
MTDPFGDVLPDRSRDEVAEGWSEDRQERDPDERLRREVPPHHR